MKPHNPVLPVFIGGQPYALALRIGELQRLEAELDIALERLFYLLSASEGRLNQIETILRLGLIGGGLSEAEASVTAKGFTEAESLIELRVIAAGLLMHALRRASPDEVDFDALGKVLGEAARSGAASPEASRTGPNTTETAPPSVSRRKRSRRSPSGSTTAP